MGRADDPDARIARLLSHPLRPRILQLVTARGETSPSELAELLGEPLARVSYHVRLLRDEGWIKLARTRPRRGATEHFYRPSAVLILDDAQWTRLPTAVRRRLSAQTLEKVIRAASAAVNTGGFDRPGAHIDRVGLDLDTEGWKELSSLLLQVLAQAEQIQDRSNRRRSSSAQRSSHPSQLALLHFEGLAEELVPSDGRTADG